MATAICFKSESADYYLFVADKTDHDNIESLVESLSNQWYIEEGVYIEEVNTQDFDSGELIEKVNDLLETVENY